MKKAIIIFQTSGTTLLIILFVAFSAKAKEQAISGMNMCLNIIVPSLLPILILTNTLIKSESSRIFDFLFKPLSKLLKLPCHAVCAVFLGLIGGYPTGAVLTEQLFDLGIINSRTAKRLLRFNFCGGVAFIITAVGTARLGSTKAGIVIYTINVLSSLIVCIAESIFSPEQKESESRVPCLNFSSALVSSVESSTKSVAVMCGYIIFFSALSGLVTVPQSVMPMIEITNGIFSSDFNIPLPYLCFFLSFGGVCIHFQLFGIIQKVKMKYFDFFIHRLLGGVISYFLGKAYILLFAPDEAVFGNISKAIPKSGEINGSLSLVLLASCVVIVVDLNNKKSKLI